MRGISSIAAVAAALLCGPSIALGDVSYLGGFAGATGLNRVGDAVINGSQLRLTRDVISLDGGAWTSNKQPITGGFETSFVVRMSGASGTNGADGMAFVIQSGSPTPVGSLGSGLGYSGFTSALVIELDTILGTPGADINGNHIAVMSRGALAVTSNHLESQLAAATPAIDLNGGADITVDVIYFNGILEVRVNGVQYISVPVDFTNVNGLGSVVDAQGRAWVGFTAATGGLSQEHRVNIWFFDAYDDNPTIISGPVTGTSLCGTQSVNLTVVASGNGPGALAYQWYWLSYPDGVAIPGATNPTLTVTRPMIIGASPFPFVCRVYDSVVPSLETAVSATVSDGEPSVSGFPPPLFPGCLGYPYSMNHGTVLGTPTPTLQWYLGDDPIPGATNLGYTIPSLDESTAGPYTLRATNPCGTWTSVSFTVPIGPTAPQFISTPTNMTAGLGDRLELSVTWQPASLGGGTFSPCTWYRNGVVVQSPGPLANAYTIPYVQPVDFGVYRVEAQPACGGVGPPLVHTFTLGPSSEPIVIEYQELRESFRKAEMVRAAYLKGDAIDNLSDNRWAAVSTALRELATLNPHATLDQLNTFAAAYHNRLTVGTTSTPNPSDPRLLQPINFMSLVRFSNRINLADDVPGLHGMNTDIARKTLRALGLDIESFDPYSPDNIATQKVKFLQAFGGDFSFSRNWQRVLTDGFRGIDAAGQQHPALAQAVQIYFELQGLAFDLSYAELAAEYPGVAAALALLPANTAAFEAQRAAGFPGVGGPGGLLMTQLDGARADLDQTLLTLDAALQANPSVINPTPTDPGLIRAQYQQGLAQLSVRDARFSAAAFLLDQSDDAAVREFAAQAGQVASLTIQVDKKVKQATGSILGTGYALASIAAFYTGNPGSGISFLGQSVASWVGTFWEPGGESPEQQLAGQIEQVSQQIAALTGFLDERLNRIDSRLNALSDQINAGFDQINYQTLQLQDSVFNISQAIGEAQSSLNRLEASLFGLLIAGFRQNLTLDMSSALFYRESLGFDLPFGDVNGGFVRFESSFNTWASDFSDDPTYAGPTQLTLVNDATAVDVLGNAATLGQNINNLRLFPTQLGLPALSSNRIADPQTWSVAADAYAQLARENPWYFARRLSTAPGRLDGVRSRGTTARAAMQAARSPALFSALQSAYTSRAAAMRDAIAARGAGSMFDDYIVGQGLSASIDPWGGINQRPGRTSRFTNIAYRWGSTGNEVTLNLPADIDAAGMIPEAQIAAHFGVIPGLNMDVNISTNFDIGQAGLVVTMFALNQDSLGLPFRRYGVVNHLSGSPQRLTATWSGPIYGLRLYRLDPSRFSPFTHDAMRIWVVNNWPAIANVLFNGGDPATLGMILVNVQGDGTGVDLPSFMDQTIVAFTPFRNTLLQQFARLQGGFYRSIGSDSMTVNPSQWSELKPLVRAVSASAALLDAFASIGIPRSINESDVIRSALRDGELGLSLGAQGEIMQQWLLLEAARLDPAQGAPPAPDTAMIDFASPLLMNAADLAVDLDPALAPGASSQPDPYMAWTIANLANLKDTFKDLARDDTYFCPPGGVVAVMPGDGPLENDAAQDPSFVSRGMNYLPGVTGGSFFAAPADGAFIFVAASGFAGDAMFSYTATGTMMPPPPAIPVSVISDPARVVIRVGPCAPSISLQPSDEVFQEGGIASFSVVASSAAPLAYQWFRNGEPVSDDARIRGSATDTLIITDAIPSDVGEYSVLVSTETCGTLLSAPAQLEAPPACPADIDGDGFVGLPDLAVLIQNWTLSVPPAPAQADIDGSGDIGLGDVAILIQDWAAVCQ